MRTSRRVRRALAASGLALAAAQVGAACDPPVPPDGGPVRLDEGGAGRSAAYHVNDAGHVVGTTDGLAVWGGPQAPVTTFDVSPDGTGAMNERGDVVARVALARPYRSVLVRDGVTTTLDGQAVDIDEAGRVLLRSVGGTADDPATDTVVVWDEGQVTPVAVPPTFGGYMNVGGFNDAGQVFGTANAWPDIHTAFVSQGGRYRTVGPPGTLVSINDINEQGVAVGTHNAWGSLRAFVWDGTMRYLALPSGRTGSYGKAINEAGEVMGEAFSGDVYDAVVWRGGVPTTLGALGGTTTVAVGMNEQGDVVGNTTTGGFGQSRAFLWRDGVLTELAGLGGAQNSAWDINEDGLIVGTSTDTQDVTHAVAWQR